jgi:hypothetical protein
LRALDVAFLEESRVFSTVELLARFPPDQITELVPGDGAKRNRKQEPEKLQAAGGSEDAGCDQQGIAREEEADEQPCLNENDGAYEECPAPLDQALNVVEVL